MLLHDFFDIKKPKVKEDSWHGGGNEPKDAWHSEAGVVEGRVDSPVSSAITRRILNQRHDLLKFGPQAVMDAVDQVAEWVGEVEEIGSSDVSVWVAQVARYLQTQDGQGVAEGLPGEFIGGTAGGVGGAVVGAAVGGPMGALVGGAAGGTAGQIAGRELTDEQKLNEFGPLLAAGARLFMAAAPKIAQVFGKVGQAGARGVGQAAKAGAGIAAKNAGQIGVGVGAYEIGSSVADIVKDITAKVGAAVDEKTIFDLATLAFKYAIPAGIVLAILYGGKKAIDSLFADPKTPQGVAEGFPHDVDHMSGKTIKHQDTNCATCHGRKSMYKLGGKLSADNKQGAEKVKCPTCKGTGDKPGVAEDEMADFIAGGGKITQVPFKPPRKGERLGGSRHIGGGGDTPTSRHKGISANTQGNKVIGLTKRVAETKADYKIKSIGTDSKGDYYISPSTGKKVYKKAKVGDHENPKTGEHKGVSEGANYWTKLQDTRNKKINSLVDELEKSIK